MIERTECEHELCYDKDNAAKLATYIWQLKNWAEGAWILCGPEE